MMRGLVLVLVLAMALPAHAQDGAVLPERMSEGQRAEYRQLLRGYIDAFRIFGRSRICRLDFEADAHFREVARRHGEGSEALRVVRLAFDSGEQNLLMDESIYPKPPAPMPCDVMVYMRGLGIPPLPASLVQR